MNATVKGLIACGVGLALLGGGFLALKLTSSKDADDQQSSAAPEELILWHEEADTISSMEITAGGETYSIVPSDVVTQDDAGNDVKNYKLKGYDDLPMNLTMIRTPANNAAVMEIQKIVEENPEDLEKYGLSKPKGKAVVSFENGNKHTLLVGDETPTSGFSYCMADDKKTVYTVSTMQVTPYIQAPTYYVDTTIEAALPDGDKTVIESVRIQRKDLDYDIAFAYDEFYASQESGGTSASHIMTEPITCNVNPVDSKNATHGLFGLAATSAFVLHPTEAQLAEAGLSDPFCTVTVKTDDGKTRVLKLGNTYKSEDGSSTYYFGYYEGTDIIYGFGKDSVCWATLQPMDIASTLLVVTYVWDVGKLTVEADGHETMRFAGRGSNKDDYQVTLNGTDTSSERYRKFYSFLLQTAAEEILIPEQTPTGKSLAKVTLERQDGKKTQTVEFLEAEGKKVFIVVDGHCAFKCRRGFVDTLLENMDRYKTDQDFLTTW